MLGQLARQIWSRGRAIPAFMRDTRGATAIEYALIAGIISIAIVAGITPIGGKLAGMFQPISDSLHGD